MITLKNNSVETVISKRDKIKNKAMLGNKKSFKSYLYLKKTQNKAI